MKQANLATYDYDNSFNEKDFNKIDVTPAYIDQLLESYSSKLIDIDKFIHAYEAGILNSIYYFSKGYDSEGVVHHSIPNNIIERDYALKGLNSDFWSQFLRKTNILSIMPAHMKDEWDRQINSNECPEFNRNNVLSTYEVASNNQSLYFSERILAVFKQLSKIHKTNSGVGFGQKLIINNVYDKIGVKDHQTLSELRSVISIMIGRCSPNHAQFRSYELIQDAYNNSGVWHEIDGGALRLKVFKKGTAHIQIDRDIVIRLNEFLSNVMPLAIGDSKKIEAHTFKSMYKPSNQYLPVNFLSDIESIIDSYRSSRGFYYLDMYNYSDKDGLLYLFTMLGATTADTKGKSKYIVQADYDLIPILKYIVRTGLVPDWKDHQFYPTNDDLAEAAAYYLNVQPTDKCLDAGAGHGALSKHLNENSTLVEISPLNCEILKQKGFSNVIAADFIEWARKTNERFDKVIMNPPYKNNQAIHHIKAAYSLLAAEGIITAIVPSSFKDKELVKGANHEYSNILYGEFDSTNASVVIVTISK